MRYFNRVATALCRSGWLFAVICWLLPAALAAPSGPVIDAESYILMDAETGTVLAESDADLRLPPASLTKIMATYLYFRALADGVLEMEQEIDISPNAWGSKVVGSKMFIEVNTRVSVRDLLYGVIVQSGNDASIALAEALAGDEKAFADEMNRVAAEIGLINSRFQNSTGLPAKEHYVTARDVAVMVRRTVLDFPEWYKIYAEPEFTYNDIRQPNRNGLLESFPGADGVKTGYTKAAGYCLASSAVRDGRRLIAVVMKTKSPRARENASTRLLTYGFNQFHNTALFREKDMRELTVWQGEQDQVTVHPAEDGVFTVPRGVTLRLRFHPQQKITAPVTTGMKLGEIEVIADNEVIRQTDVVAATPIAAGGWWKRFKDYVKLEYLNYGNEKTVLSEW